MRYVLAGLLIVSGAALTAGCGGDQKARGPDYYRNALADDLHTPTETIGEVENRKAHTYIMNLRKLNAEWDRIWLVDHPSWSLGAPTPYE